jgi:hypothetical protein
VNIQIVHRSRKTRLYKLREFSRKISFGLKQGGQNMSDKTIQINRAPVLTLWAAVVSKRLGFNEDEALTLGKVLAGLNAQSKGQRLGIFEPGEEKGEKAREREHDQEFFIQILGRPVPAVNTEEGVRATTKGKPVDPDSVRRYLQGKFGDNFDDVRAAMEDLAGSFSPTSLARRAFRLYEEFRPEIPEGTKGWGAKGDLNLGTIRSLKE